MHVFTSIKNNENKQIKQKLVLCRHCDLVMSLPESLEHSRATCPRCRCKIDTSLKNANLLAVIYAICALFMLMLACHYLFVSMNISGISSTITLFEIPSMLFKDHFQSLAILFISLVLFIPVLCLVIILLLGLNVPLPRPLIMFCLKTFQHSKEWCMAEIFLAGVLVSFVKLISYGDIGIHDSFISYCFFVWLQLKAFIIFDSYSLWNRVAEQPIFNKELKLGRAGLEQGARLCRCCLAILPVETETCPRCYEKGHARLNQSITWTLSLVVTALLIYIPANMLPIMTTVSLGSLYDSNIMSGVIFMWRSGSYPVALIIFIASILIPSLKIIGLLWLCIFSRVPTRGTWKACLRMQYIYSVIEIVGRWSMIDIFVVAVLSSLVNIGILMSVFPDIGVTLFALVVLITMFAAIKFDSRLIWDRLAYNKKL